VRWVPVGARPRPLGEYKPGILVGVGTGSNPSPAQLQPERDGANRRIQTTMKTSIGKSLDAARAFAVAGLLISLAACGGDSTAAAGPSSPSPTPVVSKPSAQPSPTGTPAPPAVIPNLTQDTAMQLYLDQGFDCVVVQASHPTWTRHRCSKTASSALATVDLEGPGTAVADLKAATIGMPDTVVEGFLGDSASLPFDGSASDQAQQWVTDSLPNGGGTTVIGGVQLQLVYSPPVAWVTLKPAS
jgi:hypothetical protein